MKNKSTLLKRAFALFAIVLMAFCLIQPQTVFAWNDDDPDNPFDSHSVVTFGLYKSETGDIEISQPDYFFDHFKYGITHSIYNYLYRIWSDNANFNYDVSIVWDNILEKLGSTFFQDLSDGYWLMNVYLCSSYEEEHEFLILCNRAPNVQTNPRFDIRQNIDEKLTVEFLPENYGGTYVFFKGARMFSYAPYYINDNVPLESNNLETQLNEKIAFSSLHTQMQDLNFRTFWFTLNVNCLTGNVSNPSNVGWVKYYNSSTLRGITEDLYYRPVPVMVDFPVFKEVQDNYYSQNFAPSYNQRYDSITFKINNIANVIAQHGEILIQNTDLSPIIISRYSEIPVPTATPTPIATATPTPTPTAIPTITLVPSPTPSGVSPIEGVETMFSLFTRKYDINIMGVTVGIRPFFLFIGCFVVGSVITMIQGGNKS